MFVVSGGAADVAYLNDASGSALFVSSPAYSYLSGTGFFNMATGFKTVVASTTTGSDTAYLLDAPGNDTFVLTPAYSYLSGSGLFQHGHQLPKRAHVKPASYFNPATAGQKH